METIQQELRKTAHYLSMRKREQAAEKIDKLQAALNQYSEDDVLLMSQSTIAAQAAKIESLTQSVVDRDLIISQYITSLGYVAA